MSGRAKNTIPVSKEDFYRILADDKYKRIGWKDPEDGSWSSHREVIQDTDTKTTVGYQISSSYNPNVRYYLKEDFLRSLPENGGIDIEGIKERIKKAAELKERKDANKKDTYDDIRLRRAKTEREPNDSPGLFEFLESQPNFEWKDEDTSIDMFVELLQEIWFDRIPERSKPIEYIEITEGWMGTDESPFWGFSARMGNILTGKGGFLKFVEDGVFAPIKYNGRVIPESEYDEFIKYCKE